MDTICISSKLKELLESHNYYGDVLNSNKIKKKYIITLDDNHDLETPDKCNEVINVLFDWINKNNIEHIDFKYIRFLFETWLLLSYLIKFSCLKSITFDQSWCVDDVTFVKCSIDTMSLFEIIFESKLTKINFINESFKNN